MVYVCDYCGAIDVAEAVPEGGEWACGKCGNHAAWEYPEGRRRHAEQHSADIVEQIARGRTRIFRRVL